MSSRTLQATAMRYFLEVVRTGSVKDAAARLSVAPSAVSRQVARLERDMDTLLFERHARGMLPSAAGAVLAAHAKRAQEDSERVVSDIGALRGLRSGVVKVVSNGGFAFDFIPGLIARFREKHAGITFHVETCAQVDIPQRIRDREADIALTLSWVPEVDIAVEMRHPSPVLAVMSARHPLARQRQLALAQVVKHPLALPQASSSIRKLLEVSCSRQGLGYTVAMSSNHTDALISFVALDPGCIAFYGELAVRTRLAGGDLVAIPLRDRELNERYLEIQTLSGRPLSDAGRAFVDFMSNTIRLEY